MTLGTWIGVVVAAVVVAGTVWELKRPKRPKAFSRPEPDLSPADQRMAELRRDELRRDPPPPYRSRRPRRADGMTWTALAILMFVLALAGAQAWLWLDSRQVPEGADAVSAEVVDRRPIDDTLRRNEAPDFEEVAFVTEDDREGTALYEKRWIAAHDAGDTITVYESPDPDREWQTTSEKSWGGLAGIVAGLGVYLLLLYGWFRVRGRTREDSRRPPIAR